MAVNEVRLHSKDGTSQPTSIALEVGAIAANLYHLDRPLKKAGQPEMRPFFEADEKTWFPPDKLLNVFENAKVFFSDDSMGDILSEVVVEQLGPAIEVVRSLPKGSVVRLEVIKSKPRKPTKPKPAQSGRPGPDAPSSTIKMRLSKQAAADVAWAMSLEETKLAFEGFIAHWMRYEAREAIQNTRPRHPNWPEKWLERRVRFDWISDWPNGWYLRGIARRAATGDLDEFGLFLQMHVRQAVLNHHANSDEYTELWELLPALAIGDDLAIERHLAQATFPLSGGHPVTRIIYNGVHSLLRGHAQEIDRLRKTRLPEKSPARLKGLVHCIQGIANRDAARVTEGIDQHLKGFYQAFRIDPMEKIISLEAHGMYRLAERIDPTLVARFDVGHDLPWDREFHAWSNDWRPSLAVDHFGDCPRDLCEPFVTLKVPAWLKDDA